MFLSYLTLAVALSLSVIAAYYSIAGLATIFAAAVIPIVVMGSILELGKVVVTLWLHEYWRQCRLLMKMYLVPAVAVLMLITSMGIFGFLSKAHSDQSLVSGDVQARISVYDEKIKTQRDNIELARRALAQMDAQVDARLSRGDSEAGAERAVQIRRQQAAERAKLQREIADAQKVISRLQEERAPIAAEIRKVEAEVGPIKYIAALIYDDIADTNVLEKAVRWVIILLVIVFDPLAIMMLLAATESLKWERERRSKQPDQPQAITEEQPESDAEPATDPSPPGWMFDISKHSYLTEPFVHFKNIQPMVSKPEPQPVAVVAPVEVKSGTPVFLNMPSFDAVDDHTDEDETSSMKAAIAKWKAENPTDTLKNQRSLFARGEIAELPWIKYLRQTPEFGFGDEFAHAPTKGDLWMKTDRVPYNLYKFNGDQWIPVDKNQNDSYTYDTQYLDFLIGQIAEGKYSTDLLSESEQQQLTQRLLDKK